MDLPSLAIIAIFHFKLAKEKKKVAIQFCPSKDEIYFQGDKGTSSQYLMYVTSTTGDPKAIQAESSVSPRGSIVGRKNSDQFNETMVMSLPRSIGTNSLYASNKQSNESDTYSEHWD